MLLRKVVAYLCLVSLHRLWGGIHRNRVQRQSGRAEVPGVLHKVSSHEATFDALRVNSNLCVLTTPPVCVVNRGEEVVAAASLAFDPAVAQVAELMAEGKTITKKQAQWVTPHGILHTPPFDFCSLSCLQHEMIENHVFLIRLIWCRSDDLSWLQMWPDVYRSKADRRRTSPTDLFLLPRGTKLNSFV